MHIPRKTLKKLFFIISGFANYLHQITTIIIDENPIDNLDIPNTIHITHVNL
jgi:hypothetical protein